MKRIQRILLYLAIITMPIQDCLLGRSFLGFVGSNLSCIPIALHAAVGFCLWISKRRPSVPWLTLVCVLYVLIVSTVYLLVWGPVSHEGSVVYKAFSGAIVLVFWIYVVFGIDYRYSKGLVWATFIAFIIMIVGVALCDIIVPGLESIAQSPIVHITPDQGHGRWRGFSDEPSMFSATAVSLGTVLAYLAKRKGYRLGIILATLLMLVLSQSKGGLMVLALSAFGLFYFKKPSRVRLTVTVTLVALIVASSLYFIVQQASVVDLWQSTGTFATRISMTIWSFDVVLRHPFGVGLAGFYQAMTIYLPRAMNLLEKVSPIPLDFNEVQDHVYGNMATVPLDTKCFFLEYAAMFGIPFIYLYWKFFKATTAALLKKHENILLTGFIFLVFGMSTYINGSAFYAAFYLFGLAYRQYSEGVATDPLTRP